MYKHQQIPLILLKVIKDSEKGLSFTEVLVSMVISSIVLALLAPLFLLSAAYRVNSLRAEQASTVAQSEIDRVQKLMAEGVNQNQTLGKLPPTTTEKVFSKLAPPTSTVSDRDQLTVSKALEIDYDQDGKKDFLVQLFRNQDNTYGVFDSGLVINQIAFFTMGVRVYSIAAKNNIPGLPTLDPNYPLATVAFNNLKDQTEKPLAIINTEIIRGDSKSSLRQYRDYLNQ